VDNSRDKGKKGEQRAAEELEKRGVTIIDRNFRSPYGEIDLIGIENETLIFIEVKSWNSLFIDSLEQSINKKKQKRIIESAKYFLEKYREYNRMAIRFDVIFIGQDGFQHIAAAWVENI
jgi:putative endonuclease